MRGIFKRTVATGRAGGPGCSKRFQCGLDEEVVAGSAATCLCFEVSMPNCARKRQGEAECTAHTRLAFHPHLASMHLDQRLGDIESQASPRLCAHELVLSTEETAKELFLVFCRDAHASVNDVNL